MGRLAIGKKRILKSDGTEDDIAIAGAVTAYSRTFTLDYLAASSMSLKFTGTGINVKVYIEQSADNADLAQSAQGSAASNYVVPNGNSEIATITDSNWHIIPSLSLAVFKYGRLKTVGQAGNGADVVLDEGYLSCQEEV